MLAFFNIFVTLNDWHDDLHQFYILDPVKNWYKDIVEEANELAYLDGVAPSVLSECKSIQAFVQDPVQRLVASHLCHFGLKESIILLPVSILSWIFYVVVAGWLGFDYIKSAVA